MRVTIELPDNWLERAEAEAPMDSPSLTGEVIKAVRRAQQQGDAPHIFVTFEAGQSMYEAGYRREGEPEAVTVGPFNWIQLTSDMLRYAPEGNEVALFDRVEEAWKISNFADLPKWMIALRQWSTLYSDIIIHRNPPMQEYPTHRVILTHKD